MNVYCCLKSIIMQNLCGSHKSLTSLHIGNMQMGRPDFLGQVRPLVMPQRDICTPGMHARRWSVRLLEEFFAQGDRERAAGLAVSPMMDRTATSTALSQMNFIEFIVAPLYSQVPGLHAGLSAVIHERCRPNRRPQVS